ncbi:helix-turn-helix domain-containing protein, partial [Streptomyces vinaceus]|uniref:helix-turn-helix domain-containing protein n=1 Tax=Streptomyces vinaceus TaxID=1960 RepID=UPI00382E6DE6
MGGLIAERQGFREGLRLQAAERFARGEASSPITRDLRVSVRSVQRWRQVWGEGGPRALRSRGPASLPRLSEKQFTLLEGGAGQGAGRAPRGGPTLDPKPCEDGDRPA